MPAVLFSSFFPLSARTASGSKQKRGTSRRICSKSVYLPLHAGLFLYFHVGRQSVGREQQTSDADGVFDRFARYYFLGLNPPLSPPDQHAGAENVMETLSGSWLALVD